MVLFERDQERLASRIQARLAAEGTRLVGALDEAVAEARVIVAVLMLSSRGLSATDITYHLRNKGGEWFRTKEQVRRIIERAKAIEQEVLRDAAV